MGPRDDDGAAWGTAGLTAAAMPAPAANSRLCRADFGGGHADTARFATPRLAAGAVASGKGYALRYATLRRLTGILAP
jgi:hypothetical protein